MKELSQAEQYLLDAIRQGDPGAWSQLVERYQGRLLAFARSRAVGRADAEDLVQETFMHFLRGLGAYRGESSVETYLFMILRRRIVDWLRGKRFGTCLLQDTLADEPDASPASAAVVAAPDLTASAYARRDEQLELEQAALSEALAELIGALKRERDFRHLKIVEMLFYGQLRNKDIARIVGVDEKNIALIKHRWLKQLRQRVAGRLREADLSAIEEPGCADSILTEIWEEQRLSCPKRSTVGGYLLNTLEGPWQEYVEFHVKTLGCRFCQANLHDLQTETASAASAVRQRIMQSTAGFFQKP